MKKLSNKKYSVRKCQAGWVATRHSDGFGIYFENYDELVEYVNS